MVPASHAQYTLKVVFTQDRKQQQTDQGDDHLYKNSSQTYELTVEKAQPAIEWALPEMADHTRRVPVFVGQKMTAETHLNAVFRRLNEYTEQYVDTNGSDPKGLHPSMIRYQLICPAQAPASDGDSDVAGAGGATLRLNPATGAAVDVPPTASADDIARVAALGYTEPWRVLPGGGGGDGGMYLRSAKLRCGGISGRMRELLRFD